jgi:hypothetical protein
MPATRSILRSPSALVNRRDFIKVAAGSALAWPLHAYAQQKMLRIGVLWPGALPPAPPRMESFRQTLNLLGFVEDRNVVVELRYAKGGLHQLPALAAELVRRRVDVITTFGDFAPRVIRELTQHIPVVVISDDLVGAGLVSSLSAPGGNTTGLTLLSPELSAKRLEILNEVHLPSGCPSGSDEWRLPTDRIKEGCAGAKPLDACLECNGCQSAIGSFRRSEEGQL